MKRTSTSSSRSRSACRPATHEGVDVHVEYPHLWLDNHGEPVEGREQYHTLVEVNVFSATDSEGAEEFCQSYYDDLVELQESNESLNSLTDFKHLPGPTKESIFTSVVQLHRMTEYALQEMRGGELVLQPWTFAFYPASFHHNRHGSSYQAAAILKALNHLTGPSPVLNRLQRIALTGSITVAPGTGQRQLRVAAVRLTQKFELFFRSSSRLFVYPDPEDDSSFRVEGLAKLRGLTWTRDAKELVRMIGELSDEELEKKKFLLALPQVQFFAALRPLLPAVEPLSVDEAQTLNEKFDFVEIGHEPGNAHGINVDETQALDEALDLVELDEEPENPHRPVEKPHGPLQYLARFAVENPIWMVATLVALLVLAALAGRWGLLTFGTPSYPDTHEVRVEVPTHQPDGSAWDQTGFDQLDLPDLLVEMEGGVVRLDGCDDRLVCVFRFAARSSPPWKITVYEVDDSRPFNIFGASTVRSVIAGGEAVEGDQTIGAGVKLTLSKLPR